MSSDASPSIIAALQAENAQLRAREASLTRIAVQSVTLLRLTNVKERPEGLWLRPEDQALLKSVQDEELLYPAGDSWRWMQISSKTPALRSVQQVYIAYGLPVITPFRSAFPLEILERILSFVSPKTLAVFSRASFACLQIWSLRLLKEVAISSYMLGGLRSLFADRTQPSLRLSAALCLGQIQVLDLGATALRQGPAHCPPSSHRFPSGQSTLHLSKLILRLDFDPIPTHDSLFQYSPPPQDPDLQTFHPDGRVLALLDPANLEIVAPGSGYAMSSYYDTWRRYRITREGATAIASWTRLKTIQLFHVDLFVLSSASTPDDKEVPRSQANMDRFFLGPSISRHQAVANLAGLQDWTVEWHVDSASIYGPWGQVQTSSDLARVIVNRDKTLQMKRIEAATIIARDEGVKAELEKQLAGVDVRRRGPLKVKIRTGDASH